jgi:hypothetical protein
MRCRAHRQPREEHREYHPKLRGRSLEPLGGNYAKRRLFVANTPRERREAADCALSGGNASPSGSPGGRPVTPSQAPAAITPDSQPTETKRIKPSVPSGGGTRSQIPTGKLPPPPSPAFPDMAKPSPPQPQVRRPVWLRRKLPRLLQNRRPPAIRAARSNGQARSAAATPSAAKVVACLYRKSDSAIKVMKSAEDRRRYNTAHVLDGAMDRSVFVERPMCPQLVVVGGIFRQNPA